MDFLYLLGHENQLSTLPRTGWVQRGVEQPETVASHALSVAFLVRTFLPKGLDKAKCLDMAVIHDQAEVIIGDLTPADTVNPDQKDQSEIRAMATIAKRLGTPDLIDVFKEYQAQQTPEAQFVRDMDRIQAVFRALQYDRTNQTKTEAFPEFLAYAKPRIRTKAGKNILAKFLKQCAAEIDQTHLRRIQKWSGVILINGQAIQLAVSHER